MKQYGISEKSIEQTYETGNIFRSDLPHFQGIFEGSEFRVEIKEHAHLSLFKTIDENVQYFRIIFLSEQLKNVTFTISH
ncbi:MAG: hypothetical protein PHR06_09440 [Candidatus Cloacimonetes bacterium]|nr:hypothetical protein [Candidatus Cloacimonadota bacterium]